MRACREGKTLLPLQSPNPPLFPNLRNFIPQISRILDTGERVIQQPKPNDEHSQDKKGHKNLQAHQKDDAKFIHLFIRQIDDPIDDIQEKTNYTSMHQTQEKHSRAHHNQG